MIGSVRFFLVFGGVGDIEVVTIAERSRRPRTNEPPAPSFSFYRRAALDGYYLQFFCTTVIR